MSPVFAHSSPLGIIPKRKPNFGGDIGILRHEADLRPQTPEEERCLKICFVELQTQKSTRKAKVGTNLSFCLWQRHGRYQTMVGILIV